MNQKTICVAAAIIYRNNRILACKRPGNNVQGGWEFPGGKIEAGESSRDACKREIAEELEMRLSTTWSLCTTEYDYPGFHLQMECFVCMPVPESEPIPTEHEELRWLSRDELLCVDWLPADLEVATLVGTTWDQIFSSEHL